ncbi:MAG: rhombosortase [Halofilum sp. (in: g-proteobacteria)]|nr:rhombosortase [Halofilum sp. (in: g-proteobacteria)]
MNRDTRIAIATLAVALACALLQATGAESYLRYDRYAIGDGEVWRLVSGHFVHLGTAHLAVNVAGLALVALLVGRHLSLRAWGATLLVCCLVTAGGLLWLSPNVRWYVGLSGVLHGLLIAGAAHAARRGPERTFNAVVLAIVGAKLGWEQFVGALPGTSRLAGGSVIVDAHLFGAVGGLAVAVLLLMRR